MTTAPAINQPTTNKGNTMIKLTTLALVAIVLGSGCTSAGSKTDPTKIAMAYYQQDRTYDTLKLTGVTELTLKGTNLNIAVANQLTPLSIYPRDPSTLKTVIDGAARIATTVGAAYVGNTLAGGLSRGPTVVNQPEPIIVEVPMAQ